MSEIEDYTITVELSYEQLAELYELAGMRASETENLIEEISENKKSLENTSIFSEAHRINNDLCIVRQEIGNKMSQLEALLNEGADPEKLDYYSRESKLEDLFGTYESVELD